MLNERPQVGGERVVVISARRPAGQPEAAPVVGDDPVACLEQRQLLTLPGGAAEREAVHEQHRWPDAVVLEVQLGAVLAATMQNRQSPPPTVERGWPEPQATALRAARITSVTTSGCDIIGTCEASTSVI